MHVGSRVPVLAERTGSGIPAFPLCRRRCGLAREHGYGRDLEQAIDASVGKTPNERYIDGLPTDQRAAALEALNGNPARDGLNSRLTAHLPSGGQSTGAGEGASRPGRQRVSQPGQRVPVRQRQRTRIVQLVFGFLVLLLPHPLLLRSLAATGHGSRILIADANYAHATSRRTGEVLMRQP